MLDRVEFSRVLVRAWRISVRHCSVIGVLSWSSAPLSCNGEALCSLLGSSPAPIGLGWHGVLRGAHHLPAVFARFRSRSPLREWSRRIPGTRLPFAGKPRLGRRNARPRFRICGTLYVLVLSQLHCRNSNIVPQIVPKLLIALAPERIARPGLCKTANLRMSLICFAVFPWICAIICFAICGWPSKDCFR